MHVEINLTAIEELSVKSKVTDQGLMSTIQMECKMHPADIARIMNLEKQGCPLYAIIGTNQAAMDLQFSEIKQDKLVGVLIP